MPELILHHYDYSPFAEKVRLMFGLKGLAWRSVEIPMVMPKPDLMPLTGGYRRTPVLQVGADVYCDTQRIAAELERRCPEPSLFPDGSEGHARALAAWADRQLFWPAARFATGTIADKLPPGFHEDRAAMWGVRTDIERLKRAAPRHREQLAVQLPWIESMLADGRPYLLGERPGLADLAVVHPLWFVANSGRRVAPVLEPYQRLGAWMARLAAIGHGERSEMAAAEALDVARAAEPEPDGAVIADDDSGLAAGAEVSVAPDDYARDQVSGTLAALSADSIALRRHHERVGEVAVHFPRMGYTLRPA